jgi:Fur family ferric uptake transcriptional regulator
VVLAADAGPGRALYEVGQDRHHHLVCRACGVVVDVPCLVASGPCLELDVPGVEVDHAAVIFRGRCAACTAAAAGEGTAPWT